MLQLAIIIHHSFCLVLCIWYWIFGWTSSPSVFWTGGQGCRPSPGWWPPCHWHCGPSGWSGGQWLLCKFCCWHSPNALKIVPLSFFQSPLYIVEGISCTPVSKLNSYLHNLHCCLFQQCSCLQLILHFSPPSQMDRWHSSSIWGWLGGALMSLSLMFGGLL